MIPPENVQEVFTDSTVATGTPPEHGVLVPCAIRTNEGLRKNSNDISAAFFILIRFRRLYQNHENTHQPIGKYHPTNREALNLWDHTPRDEWSLLAFTQGIVRNYGPKSAKVLGKYLWYIKVIDSYTY